MVAVVDKMELKIVYFREGSLFQNVIVAGFQYIVALFLWRDGCRQSGTGTN